MKRAEIAGFRARFEYGYVYWDDTSNSEFQTRESRGFSEMLRDEVSVSVFVYVLHAIPMRLGFFQTAGNNA